jgi:hypothetical protein
MATFIEQFKAARRTSVPFLTVNTSDINACIYQMAQVLNGAPMISWDIIRGLVPLNDAAQPLLQLFEQDPAMMTNPNEVLNKLPLLPSKKNENGQWVGPVIFMHNLHLFLNPGSRIDEVARIAIIQGILNLRDIFKENRRTLVNVSNQIVLPPELSDMLVLDEPLPDREQLAGVIEEIYNATGVKQPDKKTREQEVEAITGIRSLFLAETVSAMCITKTGMDRDGLNLHRRKLVEQTKGTTLFTPTSEMEIAGNENFLYLMKRRMNGKNRPGALILIDEVGDEMAGNRGDNTGVSQYIHKSFLTWMVEKNVPGVMQVGIPGVGKTYGPKVLASLFGIPLLMMDIGAMKEGELGKSEANIRAALDVAYTVAGGKPFLIGTTNSTVNLSPQFMSRFDYTFMFDLPNKDARLAAWKIYMKQCELKKDQALPDDENWTPREIRKCCECARDHDFTLVEASQFIVPVAKAGAADIAKLRSEANGRYIAADKPGFYEAPKTDVAGFKRAGRAITN